MPAIGVAVKSIPPDTVIRLLGRGGQLAISEVSIFELSAKGAKYSAAGKIPEEKVLEGIRAIVANDQIAKVSPYDDEVLRIATTITTLFEGLYRLSHLVLRPHPFRSPDDRR